VARALYQNARILVLDEATSALDVETESKLTAIVEQLRGHRTVIIIAHRLSTLQGCDQIAFVEVGQLRTVGSFQYLYDQEPRFRRMVELSQFSCEQTI